MVFPATASPTVKVKTPVKSDAVVVVLTSYPVGAVMVMLFVRFDPEMVKLWAEEADPAQAVKAFNIPVVTITGAVAAITFNETL